MKIYTKTGDKGKTSLFSGERVSKNNIQIACLGTLDELNASIGVIVSQLKNTQITEDVTNRLHMLQRKLLTLGSCLAGSKLTLNQIDIDQLEDSIDFFTEHTPPLSNFILPGGSMAASACHMSRTTCRQVERLIVNLHGETGLDPLILAYINRLSDYLFSLARYINTYEGTGEITWNRDSI